MKRRSVRHAALRATSFFCASDNDFLQKVSTDEQKADFSQVMSPRLLRRAG
jgi:hypothetical protein